MSKKIESHPYHIYQRSKANKTIYRCLHAECTHYINKALLEGKRATCPNCFEPFILDAQHLKTKTPTCIGCGKRRASKTIRVGIGLMKEVLEEYEVKSDTKTTT